MQHIFFVLILFFIISPFSYTQNDFKEVTIGKQTWMLENLNVSKFQNGDSIPQAKTKKEWAEACDKGKAAWCFYNFDANYETKYGKLYNWYAVNDSRGLAPKGWKIPKYDDWKALNSHLGSVFINGEKLKSKTGWAESTTSKGTNESGFTGLPGGYLSYYKNEDNNIVEFKFLSKIGHWWTSDKSPNLPDNSPGAYFFSLCYSISNTNIGDSSIGQSSGLSIRCIKK